MLKTDNIEFPQEQVEERVQFMIELLPGAGKSLQTYRSEIHISNSESSSMDKRFMEKADRFVEVALIEALRGRFPDDGFLVEGSERIPGVSGFDWYIDPVDGSRNFVHGVPLYTIASGITYRESPVAGVVHAPGFQETYSAILGQGAYKNDIPIEVSSVDSVERSLVSNGLPYQRREILTEILADLSSVIASGIGLRRTGSGTLDLCWIAEGRFDAMWERDMDPWDLCGAGLILHEAGGKITGFAGENYHLDLSDIVASNNRIHENIIEILQDARRVQGHN